MLNMLHFSQMNPEQRPEIRNSFTPDMSQHPTLLEELRRRTTETNTTDPRAVVAREITNRYRALRAASASFDEFEAKFDAAGAQGEQWMHGREQLGLTIDQVAHQVGLSPWELMFIEVGLPSPDGVPEEALAKLNSLFPGK
jgi:hypothetical protein